MRGSSWDRGGPDAPGTTEREARQEWRVLLKEAQLRLLHEHEAAHRRFLALQARALGTLSSGGVARARPAPAWPFEDLLREGALARQVGLPADEGEPTDRVTITRRAYARPREARGILATGAASLWVAGTRIHSAESAPRLVEEPSPRPALQLDPRRDIWLRDHRPNYTRPALPLMVVADLVARGGGEEQVVGLRDLRANEWILVDEPVTLRTEREGERVRLLAKVTGRPEREVAWGRLVTGSYPPAPEPWEPLATPRPSSPYADGRMFHGPAFQVLERLASTPQGASAILQAAGAVPPGLLNPALLDGGLHAIPQDDLRSWFPDCPAGSVAFPVRLVELDLFGPAPVQGRLRCEVRPAGAPARSLLAVELQWIGPSGVWARARVLLACVPLGPAAAFTPRERAAFLRERLPVPGLRCSRPEASGASRLRKALLEQLEWLPGSLTAIYGTSEPAELARREHIAAAHGLHPGRVRAQLPLTRWELSVRDGAGEVLVEGDGLGTLDLERVEAAWAARLPRGLLRDLLRALVAARLERVVHLEPPEDEVATVYLLSGEPDLDAWVFAWAALALELPGLSLVGGRGAATEAARELARRCAAHPEADPAVRWLSGDDPAELAAELAAGRSLILPDRADGVERALALEAPLRALRLASGRRGGREVWIGAPLDPEALRDDPPATLRAGLADAPPAGAAPAREPRALVRAALEALPEPHPATARLLSRGGSLAPADPLGAWRSALAAWLRQVEAPCLVEERFPVRVARSEAERDAIRALRYRVYVDELQRRAHPAADHARRRLGDAGDGASESQLLYVGSAEQPLGTLRLQVWRPGTMPAERARAYSLERFPDGLRGFGLAEMSLLAVDPAARGSAVMAALGWAAFERGAQAGGQVLFVESAPDLVPMYLSLGFRPYGGRLLRGVSRGVPLVVFADPEHVARAGALARRFLRRLNEGGSLNGLDPRPLRAACAAAAQQVVGEPKAVAAELLRWRTEQPSGLLRALPRRLLTQLAGHSFVLAVEPGDPLIRAGLREQELFLVLSGAVELRQADGSRRRRGPGEPVGEAALLRPDGCRAADARVVAGGRVLVVDGGFLRSFLARDSEEARLLRAHMKRAPAPPAEQGTGGVSVRSPDPQR